MFRSRNITNQTFSEKSFLKNHPTQGTENQEAGRPRSEKKRGSQLQQRQRSRDIKKVKIPGLCVLLNLKEVGRWTVLFFKCVRNEVTFMPLYHNSMICSVWGEEGNEGHN